MASTLRLDFLQGLPEYVGKNRFEIANHLANHDCYIAIVQFESMGTYFGCCRTIEELEEVLSSPNCKMREVLYHVPDLKDSLLPLEAKGILKYSMPSATEPAQKPSAAPKGQSAAPPAAATSQMEVAKPRRPIAGYILAVVGVLIAIATACLSAILLLAYLSNPELSTQMGMLRLVLLSCGLPLFLLGVFLTVVGGIVIYRARRAAKVIPPPVS